MLLSEETSLVRECAYLGEDVEGKSNKVSQRGVKETPGGSASLAFGVPPWSLRLSNMDNVSQKCAEKLEVR